MNIQKTFLILSLCLISHTFYGNEAPMRSRNEQEAWIKEYHKSNQVNSQETSKEITIKVINSETTNREEIIRKRINKVRKYLKSEAELKKEAELTQENQTENSSQDKKEKSFIKPESKLLVRLFNKIKKFNEEKPITLPKTTTLEGPTGSGKTTIAKEVAKELAKKWGAYLYVQPASAIGGIHAGEGVLYSEMLFEKVLEDAKKHPVVVLIDEVDGIIKDRKNLGGGSASADMCNTMLYLFTQIDELEDCNIMFIFTTNRLCDLDSAFKRTERMSQIITVDLPNKKKLDDGLKEYKSLKKYKPCGETPDWLVSKMVTEKFSYGDLEFLLNEVCELVKENSHDKASEQDYYKEAMTTIMERKKKVEEPSEKEKRKNIEWDEKMFEQGKKECIDAIKLNPKADLKKKIKNRENAGRGSAKLPPWEEENWIRLKCDSLHQLLSRKLAIYGIVHENPETTTQGNSEGSSNSSKQTSTQYHQQLTTKGKQPIHQEWNVIAQCRKTANRFRGLHTEQHSYILKFVTETYEIVERAKPLIEEVSDIIKLHNHEQKHSLRLKSTIWVIRYPKKKRMKELENEIQNIKKLLKQECHPKIKKILQHECDLLRTYLAKLEENKKEFSNLSLTEPAA